MRPSGAPNGNAIFVKAKDAVAITPKSLDLAAECIHVMKLNVAQWL